METPPAARRGWRGLLNLALFAAAWCLALSVSGGFDIELFGVMLTAHDAVRPLDVSVIALAAYLLLTTRERQFSQQSFDHESAVVRPRVVVAVLAMAAFVAAVGVVRGTKTAGGSDSFGYLSQAELWRTGHVAIDQSFVGDVPWPNADWTFTPLGYRPAEGNGDGHALVPTYAPGLPLILAAVKTLVGHRWMFWVVPLSGALLVLATFGIGCRLATVTAALIGAWLVSTSTAVIFTSTLTMTDVPVAALWATAFFLLLRRSTPDAAGAGLLAGVALLVRPNLVPLAAVLGLLFAMRAIRKETRREAVVHGLWFAAALVPFIAGVALLNQFLYGSPLRSGYGRMSDFLALSNVWANVQVYAQWLKETQTPLVYAGVLALAVPLRRWWPAARDRSTFVAAVFVATVWTFYVFYEVFDSWTYLRFLLPAWPFVMVGVGAITVALLRHGDRLVRVVIVLLAVGLGTTQLRIAVQHGAFDAFALQQRFAAAGVAVGRLTPPNSVIVSMQHSGSVRYYGGRMTMRYDLMDVEWMDRAVDWLTSHGAPVYLLVEDWERPRIQQRFPNSRLAAALETSPVAVYDNLGVIELFDVSAPRPLSSTPERISVLDLDPSTVLPAAYPRLVFSGLSR